MGTDSIHNAGVSDLSPPTATVSLKKALAGADAFFVLGIANSAKKPELLTPKSSLTSAEGKLSNMLPSCETVYRLLLGLILRPFARDRPEINEVGSVTDR